MKPIVSEMKHLYSQGQSFALATVITRNGSAPRSAGAKMLVKADGASVGTVGGGKVEAEVMQLAQKMMTAQRAVIQTYVFNGNEAASMDSICGGQVEILVESIQADDRMMVDVVDGLLRAIRLHQKAWLVTVYSKECQKTDHMYLGGDGQMIGVLPHGLSAAMVTEAYVPTRVELGSSQVMIEPVGVGGSVFIFGAGHVSRSLAEFTKAVGFWTVVLDDRIEYANRERFPWADEIIVLETFGDAISRIQIDEDSYIVIVTRGHLADQTVLTQVLGSGAGYIGMIGSRRKCLLIREELRRLGFREEEISQVHAPIGLEIGAETPEEIGISIVSEMIKVRATAQG